MTVKKKPLRYFYYRGCLHKKIHINRSADLITAWHYKDAKLVKYSYVDVKRFGKRAYTTKQVGKILNRKIDSITDAMKSGHFELPEKTYTIDEKRSPFAYYWSEETVLELHDYLTTVHIGRPRKDGEITAARGLPNRKEVKAMLRDDVVFYVEGSNGKMIPTWDADRF